MNRSKLLFKSVSINVSTESIFDKSGRKESRISKAAYYDKKSYVVEPAKVMRSKLDTSNVTVKCQVCSEINHLIAQDLRLAVQCCNCNEATPVHPAPIGKRYLRCHCNCLIMVSGNKSRTACPRANCGNIIFLSHQVRALKSQDTAHDVPHEHTLFRFDTSDNPQATQNKNDLNDNFAEGVCVHCEGGIYYPNIVYEGVIRCPACHKLSSFGCNFSRKNFLFWGTISLIFFISAILITVRTDNFLN